MSTETQTPVLARAGAICVGCARGARNLTGRYWEFLLAPGTLFTLGSLILLIIAAVLNPGGLLGRGGAYQSRTPFYLAAALVGSVYVGDPWHPGGRFHRRHSGLHRHCSRSHRQLLRSSSLKPVYP